MLITMHSFKPFPIEIRSKFELPAWPYNENFFHEFKKYMHSLYVFHYQDSIELDGDKDVSKPILFPFEDIQYPYKPVFKNRLYVDSVTDTFKVIDWPLDSAEGSNLANKLKNNEVAKDMKAWTSWNAPHILHGFISNMIDSEPMVEFFDQDTCVTGKCWKPETGRM